MVPRVAGQIYPYAVKVLSHWSIVNNERAQRRRIGSEIARRA